MERQVRVVVGIDPDVDKSGVCELRGGEITRAEAMDFPSLMDYLLALPKESAVVVVEAGYLNKSNWHLSGGKSKGMAAAIGNSAGRNHEVARKIVEMSRHYGLETVERKPLRKAWRGKDGKITREELEAFAPVRSRTNQEVRDAVLLAWDWAGLPMRTARPTKDDMFNV